jgi:hypothetical protein
MFVQYSLANSREERKNLYSVLFEYILHQINETCIATGVDEYSDDEIQPIASLLAQANAAEAFYISVKLGVECIGEILRRSIASTLSRYPNSERLNGVCLRYIFLVFFFEWHILFLSIDPSALFSSPLMIVYYLSW